MRRYPNNFVTVDSGLLLILALSVWIVPIKWLFAWVLAAVLHELFHILALYSCRSNICSVSFGVGGARILTGPMTVGKEIIVTLAGPLGSLLLLFFTNRFPRTALCALLQSAYNLLPIFPLDGGRALYAGLSAVFSRDVANKAVMYLRYISAGVLTIGCIGISVILKLGVLPIGICVIVLLQLFKANTSCKEADLIVQ